MSRDEKNERLADLLGWTPAKAARGIGGQTVPTIPDYSDDLNVVHVVVMGLENSQRREYWDNLINACVDHASPYLADCLAIDATAEQRVDSLIKTLEGK